MNNIWQLQDAKAKFSELIDRVLSTGTQIVTRRGKKAVAVIPYEEYERLTRPSGRLSQFLRESPLSGAKLNLERDKSEPRTIPFES